MISLGSRLANWNKQDEWDDPDVFSPTSVWLDFRNIAVPYTVTVTFYVSIPGVTLDWGDRSDIVTFDIVGQKTLTHVYNEQRQYIFRLDGEVNSLVTGHPNDWTGLFNQNSSGSNEEKFVSRLRLGQCTGVSYNVICGLYSDAYDSTKVSGNNLNKINLYGFKHGKWAKILSTGLFDATTPQKENTLKRIIAPRLWYQLTDGSQTIEYIEVTESTYSYNLRRCSIKTLFLNGENAVIDDSGCFLGVNTLKYIVMNKTSGIVDFPAYSVDYFSTATFVEGAKIFVPTSLVESYKTAFGWSKVASLFVGVDDFTDAIHEAQAYAHALPKDFKSSLWVD